MPKAKNKTIVVRPLLIEARKKQKLTTKELAEKIKVDNSCIYLLEHNQRDGTISLWKRIQKALSLKDKDVWVIIKTTKRIKQEEF